jgi:iron uptake system component EfeO
MGEPPICPYSDRARLANRFAGKVMRALRLPVIAAIAATALAACGGGAAPGVIPVSTASCGGDWHLGGPGWHTFQVRNDSTGGAEIDLINPASNAVYAEIANFGPGTTAPMRLNVGSGAYAFRCLFDDQDLMTGRTVTVPGHAKGTPAIEPVTYNQLTPLAIRYQAYTAAGLDTLAAQTATLAAKVAHGHLAAAKQAWLTAHLTYERLGAAYDAFGDFDGKINGPADNGDLTSPDWTGFYRLEYGLWHGQPAPELTPVAATLTKDVLALRKAWPGMQVAQLDVGLRTHEILENALQFQLTGHDDYGSGTTLATTEANITGTRELLSLLHPLLVPRYPALPETQRWLDRFAALLEKEHRPDGSWVAVGSLPAAAREQINAACSQALQLLAPIADITEPRNI